VYSRHNSGTVVTKSLGPIILFNSEEVPKVSRVEDKLRNPLRGKRFSTRAAGVDAPYRIAEASSEG
jgi:hypothetical protein